MAHKHAASMALYAQDAMETDTPWDGEPEALHCHDAKAFYLNEIQV